MSDLVSVTEAARRLSGEEGRKIDRGNLSRYIARYADALLPGKRGRETVVDYDRLRQHRRENLNLGTADAPPPRQTEPQRVTARMRREEADAILREMDVEKALGSVTPVSEVTAAAQAAIAAMQVEAERAVREGSEIIARALGGEGRAVRPHLKHIMHRVQKAFADAMRERVRALDSDFDAPAPAAIEDVTLSA